MSIVLQRKSKYMTSTSTTSQSSRSYLAHLPVSLVDTQFTVKITLSAKLRDTINKLCLFRASKRCSALFLQRSTESFQSNFNIITYINTEPIIPSKFAPKPNHTIASITNYNTFGIVDSTECAITNLVNSSTFIQQQFTISDADQLLLEQISGVNRIHVVSICVFEFVSYVF